MCDVRRRVLSPALVRVIRANNIRVTEAAVLDDGSAEVAVECAIPVWVLE